MLPSRLVAAAALACTLAAESSVTHLLELKMFQRIKNLDEKLIGVLGVASVDLTSGRVFVYNGDARFPTASSIKIAILIKLYELQRSKDLSLDDRVEVKPAELVGSSPVVEKALQGGPAQMTIRALATAMIQYSDNTATNVCIRLVKLQRVNEMLDRLKLPNTRLRRVMMDIVAAARGDENVSTPLEMVRLVEMIYRHKVVDAASCDEMLAMMKLVKAGMRAAIPAGTEIASKPGELDGVRCEVGVVYLKNRPYISAVYSTYLGENENPVAEGTRIVFDYFSKLAGANVYGRGL